MSDSITRRGLRVSTGGTAGPYIMVPVDQLDKVCGLLDRRQVKYWVEANVISLDGEPEVAFLNLGLKGNAALVQSILDEERS
jgi:hypothetical protein